MQIALLNSAIVRRERVEAILRGGFDSVRYKSTPRLRAERLAEILSRSLSRGAMRRRLRRLGVAAEFCGGELKAVSVEGGGLDVQRLDGQGQVLTGPGLDARLLEVFPELLPHTLTNLTIQLFPGASDAAISISNPAQSGSNALYVNCSLFLTTYLASGAVARYIATGTGFGPPGSTFGVGTVTDPFGSGTTISALETPQQVDLTWSAAGLNWVEIFSTQANVSPGNKSLSFSQSGYTSWTAGLDFQYVTVTYTNPPCLTCELVIQVHSACDAAGIGGALVTLSNGLSATTDGGGGATISGIPNGDYTVTVTKTGYDTQVFSYTCLCAGGSTTLTVSFVPTGGCPPVIDVVDDGAGEDEVSLDLIIYDEGYGADGGSGGGGVCVDGRVECATMPLSTAECA